MNSTQVAIIGAGPGGYVAAFHAADLGLKVTLIDSNVNPGGVCLYKGCIPSKAILHAAKVITDSRDAKNLGIEFGEPKLDVDKLRLWKESVVKKLTSGLGQLSRARNITYIRGTAKFLSSSTIEITKENGKEEITFTHAVISTGSSPIQLPFLPSSERIWDSTKALELPFVPKKLLVIGGRYIGLELGTAYAGLGSEVTVVEALPTLLGGADKDLADVVLRRIKKTFKNVLIETKVVAGKETSSGIEITLQDKNGKTSSEVFDAVLAAVGRKPNTKELGLENTKVQIDKSGFIQVSGNRQTSDPAIYAIGDVTGNPMLAHKASAEAKVAVESIAGHSSAYEPKAMPAVVFTDPELAWSGITEEEAREKNLDISVFKFPCAASGRAMTIDRTDGITKVIADKSSQRILGVGIVGVGAGDLISEATLAIEMGAVADDLSLTIHPHPTLSETLMETAEGLFGQSTHIFRPKK